MAKGKGKKGFGSYLFVLFLAVIATFLIIITIMLFSPFENILGFKYFAFKENQIILTETGGNEASPFDFQNSKININCSFAEVKVERYVNIDSFAFRFENYASGFAREDQDTDFSYEVYYANDEKSEINVDVHEPEGFLYFSKNITVSILVSTDLQQNVLSNSSINITNTSGNIYIGNINKSINVEDQSKNYLTFGDLNIKTNSGKIVLRPYINENIKNLFLKTQNGDIKVSKDLNVSQTCEIYAEGGELDFKNLIINNTYSAMFDLGDAEFYSPNVQANVEFNIKNGYFDIDNFKGSLSSNSAVDQMSNATVTIKEFAGYLSLPYVNNSRINIGSVSGDSQIYIRAKEGSVKISDLKADIAKIETTKGDVNVKTSGKDIDVKTTSGNINVTFNSDSISNEIDLISKTGNITFKVKPNLAFLLKVLNTKGEFRENNIKISWLDKIPENPYKVNGGGNPVNITTNSEVNISLIY